MVEFRESSVVATLWKHTAWKFTSASNMNFSEILEEGAEDIGISLDIYFFSFSFFWFRFHRLSFGFLQRRAAAGFDLRRSAYLLWSCFVLTASYKYTDIIPHPPQTTGSVSITHLSLIISPSLNPHDLLKHEHEPDGSHSV